MTHTLKPQVLFYSLTLLLLGPQLIRGQDESNLLMEDKRNVAVLARNGDLPFIRQEWKKFVHPIQWQNGGGRLQEELDKRFSHPVALPSSLRLQSDLEKRFSHPVALPNGVGKRFSHPVASALHNAAMGRLQDELDKRFSHPVALPSTSRLIEALEKRFAHPVASAWQSGSRSLDEEIEKRFAHPVASAWQSGPRSLDEELEKRFSHPVASAWQSGPRSLDEELEKRFSHPLTSAWQNSEPRNIADAFDKRYVGSIARGGTLGKRADEEGATEEELADALLAELVAEFLQRQQEEENELEEEAENSLEKRFVASLARTGGLPAAGKRNIAAMARDGYLTQHRPNAQEDEANIANEDNDAIETLIDEVSKRHLGALARGFNMPAGLTSGGKRNVGALARSGLLSRLSAKRIGLDEDKRNLASLLRGRLNGKRSPLRGQYLPFAYARLSGIRDSFVDPGKRNIQALLKSWRPVDQYSSGHGKRYNLYFHNNELPSTRRYVAALMSSPARVLGQQSDEQKRHLGSLLSNKGFTVQKKSVDATAGVGGNGSSGATRSKRQVVPDEVPEAGAGSVEYPMPVLQGSDFYDFEEESPAVAEEKRFLGSLARSGWVPSRQVRSPVMGAFEENDNRAEIDKRHIGALARIGWLPAFRATRLSRGKRSTGLTVEQGDNEEGASLTWGGPEIRQRREPVLDLHPGDDLEVLA